MINARFRVLPLSLAFYAGPAIVLLFHHFRDSGAEVGGLNITQAINGLLLFCMLFCLPRQKKTLLKSFRILFPLLAFSYYVALQTLIIGDHILEGIGFSVRVFFLSVVFISAYQFSYYGLIGEKWLKIGGYCILFTIALSMIFGRVFGLSNNPYSSQYAISGLIEKASITGAYLAAICPIIANSHRVSIKNTLSVFSLILLSFLSFRRSSWFSIGFILLVNYIYCVFELNGLSRLKAFLGGVLFFLGISWIVFVSPMSRDILNKVYEMDVLQGGTGSGRTLIWSISINYIVFQMDFFQTIFGNGIGYVTTIMKTGFGRSIGSHNDLLDFMISFGLLGVTLVSIFFINMWKCVLNLRQLKNADYFPIFLGLIFCLVISTTTGGVLDPTSVPIFALWGSYCGLNLKDRECPELS